MDVKELIDLRDKILQDVMPLVLDNDGDSSDKFPLLLRIIQGGNASVDLYNKAYEMAKAIDAPEDKLTAMMSILDEIDVDINAEQDAGDDTVLDNVEQVSNENNDHTDNSQSFDGGQNPSSDQ